MQKARCHPDESGLQQVVSAWFQVLFHSLVQGSFHLSLTVLVHYRSLRSIQPCQMVLAVSNRISRVPPYSGYCQDFNFLRVQGYHLLWPNFPEKFHLKLISILQSYNLHIAETIWIWAIPRSLATTQGITIVFYSTGYLDVSVLRVRFPITRNFRSSTGRVSPFGNLRIERIFAPPRSLSQLITSFIASESQGIHHTLLITFFVVLTT